MLIIFKEFYVRWNKPGLSYLAWLQLRSLIKFKLLSCTVFFFILLIFLLIDVDECSINLHNCAHVCSNIVGSFNCSCQNGFILQPDGRTCEGMIMCIILKGT